MKIKVCGMKYPDNIREMAELPVDFMGMIFYEKSPRYISDLSPLSLSFLPDNITRVGVFVNADEEYILKQVDYYGLNLIQLHGNESPELCRRLSAKIPVIKAFSIADEADFEKTYLYERVCRYFLFDTKTPQHGGSGQKFDWQILDAYKGQTPFFLSGGISSNDVNTIKAIALNYPTFEGIDLNSRFELEHGRKDILKLQIFINEINE